MKFQIRFILNGQVQATHTATLPDEDIDNAMTSGAFSSREAAAKACVEKEAEQAVNAEYGPFAWAEVSIIREKKASVPA